MNCRTSAECRAMPEGCVIPCYVSNTTLLFCRNWSATARVLRTSAFGFLRMSESLDTIKFSQRLGRGDGSGSSRAGSSMPRDSTYLPAGSLREAGCAVMPRFHPEAVVIFSALLYRDFTIRRRKCSCICKDALGTSLSHVL